MAMAHTGTLPVMTTPVDRAALRLASWFSAAVHWRIASRADRGLRAHARDERIAQSAERRTEHVHVAYLLGPR